MFDTEKLTTAEHSTRLEELRRCLNTDATKRRIAQIEAQMAAPGFWDDQETAQKLMQEMKALKNVVAAPEELRREIDDLHTLIELAQEMDDESQAQDIQRMLHDIETKLDRLEINSLFQDPRDNNPAIVSIHPGAGGTESCDWAEMLYRMITRFCEQHDFVVEVLDYQPGDEAGLKSASIRVTGPYAYGTLKSENGVHRLVRISPFDANSRRHTSFCAIEVLSEIDDTIDIEIREEDLKMDVFRSSGAGGQKVNKTSSAVRLTHLPTGIIVSCQIERSQHRNRATAMQMLRAKLYDIEMKKKQAELDAQRDGQREVAWGSQIRSYTLQPYQLIKDLRTGVETGNVDKVLDGDLDLFVKAYLKWNLNRQNRNHQP